MLAAEVEASFLLVWKDYSWGCFDGRSELGLLLSFSACLLTNITSAAFANFCSCCQVPSR